MWRVRHTPITDQTARVVKLQREICSITEVWQKCIPKTCLDYSLPSSIGFLFLSTHTRQLMLKIEMIKQSKLLVNYRKFTGTCPHYDLLLWMKRICHNGVSQIKGCNAVHQSRWARVCGISSSLAYGFRLLIAQFVQQTWSFWVTSMTNRSQPSAIGSQGVGF